MNYQFNPFFIEYEQIISPVADFKSECVTAAHKAILQNKDDLPIIVMMSGGIDSQLVAESLLLANIPFKAVIGRLQIEVINNNITFNEHDYAYAERWCHLNNVDIIYCDIDIFKQSTLLSEYALSAYTFSPQFACHMYIMKWCSDNGYFFLAGFGEMDFVLIGADYYMMDEQREFSVGEFCKLNNLTGIFQFWKQDSRLISSFIQLPTVKSLMAKKVTKLLDHKHLCFSDVFNFESREKKTGFENIQEWDYILRNYLKKYVGSYDAKYHTPISKFLSTTLSTTLS